MVLASAPFGLSLNSQLRQLRRSIVNGRIAFTENYSHMRVILEETTKGKTNKRAKCFYLKNILLQNVVL